MAEATAARALRIFPEHMDSHCVMIFICFGQKRWNELVQHAKEYLRLLEICGTSPEHFGTLVNCCVNDAWNIHMLLGIARYEIGDPKFRNSFETAIRVSPKPIVAAEAAAKFLSTNAEDALAKTYMQLARTI